MTCLEFAAAFQFPIPLRRVGRVSRCDQKFPVCALQKAGNSATTTTTTSITESKPARHKKKRAYKAAPDSRPISEVSVGDHFVGKVCDVGPANSTWLEIGVSTATGKAVRARLPLKSPPRKEDTIGALISVHVHKIQPASCRIEVRRGLYPSAKASIPEDVRMLKTLELAEELHGRVVGIGNYGAVVDAHVFRDGKNGRPVPCTGLLARGNFKKEWASTADPIIRDDVERVLAIGDQIKVWVRAARPENAKLLFDANPVTKEGLEKERAEKMKRSRQKIRRASQSTLKTGEKRGGFVREVAKYGVFVDIGVKTDGLVHYSQMGAYGGGIWKEALAIGTEVNVEVLNVSKDRVSLRLVSIAGDEEEDIVHTALSPVARVEDVEKYQRLEAKKRGRHRVHVASNGRSQMFAGAKQTSVHNSETSGEENRIEGEEGEGNEEDREGRKDDEEESEHNDTEKFSEEYFEDKYGY